MSLCPQRCLQHDRGSVCFLAPNSAIRVGRCRYSEITGSYTNFQPSWSTQRPNNRPPVSLTNCILSPSDVAVIGPPSPEVRFAEIEAEQRPRGTLATVMTHRVFHARLSRTGLLISYARGVEPTFRSNGISPLSWLGDAPHGGLSARSRILLQGCEDLVIGFKL